jgi:hypothetical protein
VLERYGDGAGPAAQNGLVAALVAAKRYAEADAQLAEASAKDALYPETLANQAALAALTGKPEAAAKALAALARQGFSFEVARRAFDAVAVTTE